MIILFWLFVLFKGLFVAPVISLLYNRVWLAPYLFDGFEFELIELLYIEVWAGVEPNLFNELELE